MLARFKFSNIWTYMYFQTPNICLNALKCSQDVANKGVGEPLIPNMLQPGHHQLRHILLGRIHRRGWSWFWLEFGVPKIFQYKSLKQIRDQPPQSACCFQASQTYFSRLTGGPKRLQIARFMWPTWGPIWGRQDPGGPHALYYLGYGASWSHTDLSGLPVVLIYQMNHVLIMSSRILQRLLASVISLLFRGQCDRCLVWRSGSQFLLSNDAGRHQDPLLLTWLNFNPSMDK